MNETLLQYGLQFGGLGLAAIVIIAWAKYVFNHQSHMHQEHKETMNTVVNVVKDNTEAMTSLKNLVQQDIDITKELRETIQRK